jgi:hypothetical protein
MEIEHNPRLTSAELAQIWNSYMTNSASVCVLKYFLNCVEDEHIKEIVQYALQQSESHIEQLKVIFNKESYPIPIGFSLNEDVDTHAPRLYSDTYILNYMRDMAAIGMNTYSASIGITARADVYDYFSTSFSNTNKLHQMAKDLMLKKGLYVRAPYINPPSSAEYIKKQSFLTGWFGERRSLTGMEISSLYANTQRNVLGTATIIGYSQVAQMKEAKEYMKRGSEIAAKHIEIFGSILNEEHLPTPMSWDSEVTDNTSFVFSDKLMMFQTTALISAGLGYFGIALAGSLRRDISTHYTRLAAEIMKYAEDGANIMIDNGWLEQPPKASNRRELSDR